MVDQVRAAISTPIVMAVREVAKDPMVPGIDLASAAPVANAVLDEITPVVKHLTNNEPWYQSRVTWGAIIAVSGPVLSLVGVSADVIDPDLAVSISTATVSLVGGALTLYGRWRARKPLVSGG